MAVPQGIQVPLEFSKTKGAPVVVEGNALFNSSIQMILRTVPGERPFRPTFGSWLSVMLFANLTEGTALQAGAEVKRALRDWEPRIEVQDIIFEVTDNTIFLTIVYRPNGASSEFRSTLEFNT